MIDPDPELNRQLVAERLGWPGGALEACRALEKEFPEWMVYWTRGSYPKPSETGYRAKLMRHNHHVQLMAATAGELAQKVAEADAALPPKWDERPPLQSLI